jgi:hypothetical protein
MRFYKRFLSLSVCFIALYIYKDKDADKITHVVTA